MWRYLNKFWKKCDESLTRSQHDDHVWDTFVGLYYMYFPWTPSWLSTDWPPVSRLQALVITCCEKQANEVNAMACLPGSRKGASNMGDTSSVLQAKFLSMQMNLQGRGVNLRHSASFTFCCAQIKQSSRSWTCKRYVCLVTAGANCKLAVPLQPAPLPEPHSRKETTAAAAEGHGRTTTGRCEPSPSGQKETPDFTEESRWASQVLEVWKRSNHQLLPHWYPQCCKKPSSLLAGAHGALSDPPQKGIALFSHGYLHSIFQVGQPKRVGISKLITWTQHFRGESSSCCEFQSSCGTFPIWTNLSTSSGESRHPFDWLPSHCSTSLRLPVHGSPTCEARSNGSKESQDAFQRGIQLQ